MSSNKKKALIPSSKSNPQAVSISETSLGSTFTQPSSVSNMSQVSLQSEASSTVLRKKKAKLKSKLIKKSSDVQSLLGSSEPSTTETVDFDLQPQKIQSTPKKISKTKSNLKRKSKVKINPIVKAVPVSIDRVPSSIFDKTPPFSNFTIINELDAPKISQLSILKANIPRESDVLSAFDFDIESRTQSEHDLEKSKPRKKKRIKQVHPEGRNSDTPRTKKVDFHPLPLKKDEEQGATSQSPKRRKSKSVKGKVGVRSNVMRMRTSRNSVYKFRPVGEPENSAVVSEDPLEVRNIKKASGNFKAWKRQAHLALPSNVGVPVDNSHGLVNVVMHAMGVCGKSKDAKTTYNDLYDQVQRHNSAGSDKDLVLPRIEITEPTEEPPVSLSEKIASLRVLAEHLTAKRQHKREFILKGIEDHSRDPEHISLKEKLDKLFVQIHAFTRDATKTMTIWKTPMHEIHGKYGIGAAAYFEWLRTILVFNILYFIIVMALVVIPETQVEKYLPRAADCNKSTTLPCSSLNNDKSFEFSNFLTGRGFLENSYMFYSGYQDTTADPTCPYKKQTKKDLSIFDLTSFRFAIICLLIFIINSIYITKQIKHHYHCARMESKVPGLNRKDPIKVILCAWDFNCCDTIAANVLHRSIWRELQVLNDTAIENKSRPSLKSDKVEKSANIIINRFGKVKGAIILHCVATFGVIITYIIAIGILHSFFELREVWLSNLNDPAHKALNIKHCHDIIPGPLIVLPAMFMSFAFFLVSRICDYISNFEEWESLESRNLAFVARVGIYYLLNVVNVFGHWIRQIENLIDEQVCYEEYFGQELYRILVFQMVFHFGLSWLFSVSYHLYKKRIDPDYKRPKFDPVNNTLNVFFLHTLSGIGFIFCPLISFLMILRLVLTFYYHKYKLMNLCRFPSHSMHMSETEMPYLVSFVVCYVITTCFNLILISDMTPSSVCGPFSHFDDHYYEVFDEGLSTSAAGFLYIFLKPGFTIVLIIILIGVTHTLRGWGNGYVKTMDNLHKYLVLERKDRDFLLEAIFQVVTKNTADMSSDMEVKVKKSILAELGYSENGDQEGEVQVRQRGREGSWKDTNLIKGIFTTHRQSLASKIDKKMRRRSGLGMSVNHSTIGNLNWDWLPLNWHRTGRRSADALEEGISDLDRKKLLEKFMQAVEQVESSVSIDIKALEDNSEEQLENQSTLSLSRSKAVVDDELQPQKVKFQERTPQEESSHDVTPQQVKPEQKVVSKKKSLKRKSLVKKKSLIRKKSPSKKKPKAQTKSDLENDIDDDWK